MPVTPVIQHKFDELRRRWQPDTIRRASPVDELAQKLWHFQETDILEPLSNEEQHWLAMTSTMVTCEKGRVFYSPEDQNQVVFILKRGRVDLYRLTEDGRKLVVATLSSHTIFGEMNLIGQGMYGCYAEAAEDCVICVLSRNDMQALVRRNPDVGLRLLAELGSRLKARESALESIAFRGVSARLADLLLVEADADGVIAGYSHQDLADRLGIYRETVSQALGRFRGEHLIEVEPRRIRILDRNQLLSYRRE